MEIMHSCHPDHPLILNKEVHKNESGRKVVCYGCKIPITDCDDDDSTAYECAICNLFLHKRCAEAPAKITHPMHSQHPLTLLPHPTYSSLACTCNVCDYRGWKWFTYHCSQCEFDIDIICALKEDRRFEHESHEHPLTVQLRPALFHCDACGTESRDYSCLCTTCPFWIHKTCASLPSIINHSKHNHPLNLAYSLPDMYRRFPFDCDICHERVLPIYWLYYCGNCRYFVHLKCARISNAAPEPLLQRDDEDEFKAGEYQNLDQLMQSRERFTYNGSQCYFDIDIICALNKEDRRFEHKSHEHPLTVQLRQVWLHCDACGTESRDYSCLCTTCPFWIHKTCASLPSIINHSKHNHPLNLAYSLPDMYRNFPFDCDICHERVHPVYWLYYCGNCRYFVHLKCASTSNAAPEPLLQRDDEDEDQNLDLVMRFPIPADKSADLMSQFVKKISLGDVDFEGYLMSQFVNIDIGCATLPTKILHESHEHPLVTRQVSDFRCSACNYFRYSGIGIAYTCETCSYNLDFRCATLPRTLTHDYDKHPIPLTYPPINDHPSEFYCEICEEEIHPKFWLYHCHECSYSFHVQCIRPLDIYSNVKFGRILKVWYHQHPLTFVRNGHNKSPCPCARCGEEQKGHPIFECSECGFKICIWC